MHLNKQLITKLIIGTKSKTRRKLLNGLGYNFKYVAPNINEEAVIDQANVSNQEKTLMIASAKALHIYKKEPNSTVICFDTSISLGNKMIFKSKTKNECLEVLRSLNGRSHNLYTACVIFKRGRKIWSFVDKAKITLKQNSDGAIKRYVAKNFKKIVNSVGCYNIESEGKEIISEIEGSFYSILGVPLVPLYKKLNKL